MKIALAQTNPTIGDLEGNFNKISSMIKTATEKGAELVVFPELAICGYPPLDLLDKKAFIDKNTEYLQKVAELSENIGIIIGAITKDNDNIGTNIFNSAVFCYGKRIKAIHNKSLLPNYDVFDEVRYFEAAKTVFISELNNIKIGISICEDAWNDKEFWSSRLYPIDPIEKIMEHNPDILINISASPFSIGKDSVREKMFSKISAGNKKHLIYVNQVGANTELIFDGASRVFNPDGNVVLRMKKFSEDLQIFDTAKTLAQKNFEYNEIAEIHEALILGIRDYFRKSGFKKAVIGLSGGIDSAIVTSLATTALGKENILCVMMPSQYSSQGSITDSEALIKNLGIEGKIIPINRIFDEIKNSLADSFVGKKEDTTEENLQARIRGMILMAFSNKFGYLLLSTGNKSELAVGYSTLYGDMCGGLAVISDLYKTTIYKLAEYINRDSEIIPINIITKAPSAELKPNQKDQDSLPPYDLLDSILYLYIEQFKEYNEIVAKGYDPETVEKVLTMVDKNEYKRRQAPPGLKITSKAFGIGRRFPIVQKWR